MIPFKRLQLFSKLRDIALQSRRDFGRQVLNILWVEVVAAIFGFFSSRRLRREISE